MGRAERRARRGKTRRGCEPRPPWSDVEVPRAFTAVPRLPNERDPVANRRRMAAVVMLHHLVDHVPEGRQPCCFSAGARAYQDPAIWWAAAQLRYALYPCLVPGCSQVDHVTIHSRPAALLMSRRP